MVPKLSDIIHHYPEFTGVHPACEAVPMIDDASFEDLVADIAENGLLEPIVRHEGLLLDGRTRLLACYVANQEIRVKDYTGSADPWVLVNEWNILRRQLTTKQKAAFASVWRDHEAEKAKQRQQATLKQNASRSGKFSLTDKGQTRDIVGKKVGVSGKAIDKISVVQEYAPEKLQDDSSLEQAYREANKRRKEKQSAPVELLPKQQSKTQKPTMIQIVTASGMASEIALPNKVVFNKTNDSVDWASWTWNPVTGCNHGCNFCYAREIANSARMSEYYPNKFEPTYHAYRLDAPANTKVPDSDNPRDGRVFVCSMADLFGKWVPKYWIDSVFQACLDNPQWEYLFLTKWPARYSQEPLIPNAWYGASVIQQSDVARIETAMQKIDGRDVVRWISLEPMLQPIKFNDLSWCDLVVIGAQTSTTQPEGFVPEFSPEFDWVVDVVNQCREFGVPYYLKANLGMQRPGMKLPKPSPKK